VKVTFGVIAVST